MGFSKVTSKYQKKRLGNPSNDFSGGQREKSVPMKNGKNPAKKAAITNGQDASDNSNYPPRSVQMVNSAEQQGNTPFKSCLVDTVGVQVEVHHNNLNEIAKTNTKIRRIGNYQFLVSSAFSDKIHSRMFSRDGCTKLLIEASIPKYLTGQNIVGREDLLEPCIEMILEVLTRAEISITPAERERITKGKFQLTRVDYAMLCDCGLLVPMQN